MWKMRHNNCDFPRVMSEVEPWSPNSPSAVLTSRHTSNLDRLEQINSAKESMEASFGLHNKIIIKHRGPMSLNRSLSEKEWGWGRVRNIGGKEENLVQFRGIRKCHSGKDCGWRVTTEKCKHPIGHSVFSAYPSRTFKYFEVCLLLPLTDTVD